MVPAYLLLSDLSVFFIKQVFSKKASSPTKQAEIMSMGLPLVCNDGVGDTSFIFQNNTYGYVMPDCSETAMDNAIAQIDKIKAIDPAKIRGRALELFSLEDGVNIYNSIYNELA